MAAQIQPVDPNRGLSQLSSILGIRQAQQNLQTSAIQQQNAAAVTQQNQLAAQQQQGVQNFFRNWDPSEHLGDDGTTDLDSVFQSPDFKSSGNAKPAIMQALLDVKNKQLGVKQQLANLNGDLVKQFTTQMGALVKDPDVVADKTDPATGVNAGRAKFNEAMSNFSQLSPDSARIAQIYGQGAQHAPQGKLSNVVEALQLQGQSASEQQAQKNPAQLAVGTGAATNIYNIDKSKGLQTGQQPVASVPNALPPGTSIVYDSNKNPFYLNTQSNTITPVGTGRPGAAPPSNGAAPGAAPPTASAPVNIPTVINGITRPSNLPPQLGIPAAPTGAGQPATGPQNAPPRAAPPMQPPAAVQLPSTRGPSGYVLNVPGQDQAVAEVGQTRANDAQYGTNKDITDQILKLSADTRTGPGTAQWHNTLGEFAGPFGGNNIADFQKVSANLDRLASNAQTQMGLPHTNEGLATAKATTGTTEYQPDALQYKTRYTAALIEGAHAYRNALDATIGTGTNQDLGKYQAFRNAWTNNFDPKIFELKNAVESGNTGEQQRIIGAMSTAQRNTLLKKRANLQLLEQGQIPQQ